VDASIILGLVSAAAAITLIIGHQRHSEKIKMLLGGTAVAAALIAASLIAERF
jgi:hypothetical protein